MRKWIIGIMLLFFITIPVSAMEFHAPTAPEAAQKYMPDSEESFAQGLWQITKNAIEEIHPEISSAGKICLAVIIVTLLLSVLNTIGKSSTFTVRLTGAVVLGIILMEPLGTLIRLGADCVQDLSAYCKLLLPIMTAALAAQGGSTISAALYTGTAFFNALLSTIIARIIVPMLYIYLCLCIAGGALEHEMLKKLKNLTKWIITWLMKWTLYIFTGYISVTGVVSGSVDASVLKAAKLGISGAVPVVGNILSDATEAILVSAGVMKNAAGVYGIFAALSICVAPFLKIGVPYVLLKLTSGLVGVIDYKPAATLVQDFATGMGMVLAMTGAICVILLISIVCFMKGLG